MTATRKKIPLIPADAAITITAAKTLTVPLDASVSGTNTGDNATNSQYSGLASAKETRFTFDVKDYGALCNGTADDTTAIQAAIDAAAVSGGIVFFPQGITISGTLTMKSKVHLRGAGFGTTILKLKTGTNADLIIGEGFATLTGTNNNGGINSCSILDMSLDGNSANNSAGDGIKIYAKNFLLQNLRIYSFHGDGIYTEWSNTWSEAGVNDAMECSIKNIKSHDNGGTGFNIWGPHDGFMSECIAYNNVGGNNFNFAGNSNGFLTNQCHSWGDYTDFGVVLAAPGVQWNNSVAETDAQTAILSTSYDCAVRGGSLLSPASGGVGIQIGTAILGSYGLSVDTFIQGFYDGAINFVGAEGANNFRLKVSAVTGYSNAITGNTPNVNDDIDIISLEGGQASGFYGTANAVKRVTGYLVAGQGELVEGQLDVTGGFNIGSGIANTGESSFACKKSDGSLWDFSHRPNNDTGRESAFLFYHYDGNETYVDSMELHTDGKAKFWNDVLAVGKIQATNITATSAATSATTGTITVDMSTDIITCTPTNNMTLNASEGVTGQIVTLHFATSGTSAYTITFGTNFRKTGTLSTGTVSARFFSVTFRCINGTVWSEMCRTAVQT